MIWKNLYQAKSGRDKGSLLQLKTAINRSNVPQDPKNNMNAAEAFIEDALAAHVLAAAGDILGYTSADDLLSATELPSTFTGVPKLADDIIAQFVEVDSIGTSSGRYVDEVQQRAVDTLTIGLLWSAYHDAVREGNGEMVVEVWRYLLLIFRMSKRNNYAYEAASLLVQLEYLCSERMQMQIKYARFVNTLGQIGKNVPCDLHMEHLNRYKYILHYSNVTMYN